MTALFIKICGLTTPEAVEAALDAGVDAIGFVFAESKRQVTPKQANELAKPARGKAKCVAVTRHPNQRNVDEILSLFSPDVFQTDAEDFVTLTLPATVERCPVVRAGAGEPQPLPARVLFEGPVSGTGITADWNAARKLAQRTQLILAGGLSPENVAQAIAEVRPFGVDVSSGVEQSPGCKNPEKIARFVRSARAASRSLNETLRAKENAS
jgi:phosphoribosylanthranilate isomerase